MTHKKREHVGNATASNVELVTGGRTNHPRARYNDARLIEAALVAEIDAALASLPPMTDAPDDLPF